MAAATHRQYNVRVSSADDISYNVPSTSSADTSDAIQTIVTGRKCWKTIKGKGEVVWPPYLEAALVEGLEKYRPVETRSARALGRFPLRNKFISDYIFNRTGKRRTPKQVGSRLQQLRDTCEGKRILKLLSRRPGDPPTDDEGTQDSESRASVGPTREVLTIDILPDHIPWSPISSTPSPSTSANSLLTGPRPIRAIDNNVTFKCGAALPSASYSSFQVFKHASPVHQETTTLTLSSSSCVTSQWTHDVECTFLYSTRLVPQFWPRLCEAADIGAYSILQQVIRRNPTSDSPSSSSSSSPSPVEEVAFEVMYRFNTCHSPVPQSPISSNGDAASYSSESGSELNPEYDDYSLLQSASVAASSALSQQRTFPQSSARRHYAASHGHAPPPSSSGSSPSTYDLPPGLIHAGEDGYSSLPQSPLDLAFASTAAGMGMGGDVESMCARYAAGCNIDYGAAVSVPVQSSVPGAPPAGACFDAGGPGGLVGQGFGVGVNVNVGYETPF